VLSGQVQYRVLDTVALRADYVHLTDKLIHLICREIAATDRPVELVFLDKSGRPVAWLVRSLWQVLARSIGTPYGAGAVPPMPRIHFANIDREQWWDQTGASETGKVDTARVPQETISGLRGAFLVRRPAGTAPGVVFEIPAYLDNRHLVVIDEVSNTGDTLLIACGLVARAFPTSTVRGAHWMTPGVVPDRRSGQRKTANVPVWYSSQTVAGRLVGDRQDPNHRGTHWRGRVGADFLSTVPPRPDQLGIQLRHEITQLGEDVTAGRLLVLPSLDRAMDDIGDRIREIYGYDNLKAFTQARLAQLAD